MSRNNGCFKKINQYGESAESETASIYPEHKSFEQTDWVLEMSLDMDMVSAICPECKILLVEANYAGSAELDEAEDEAAAQKPVAISNSWGSNGEEEKEGERNQYFEHSGIPVLFAAGDELYGAKYPASSSSPNVISVGGTQLKYKPSGGGEYTEEVWNERKRDEEEKQAYLIGSGGGCSKYELKPAWQPERACGNKRTDNEIAALAQNVSMYDSYELAKEEWWEPHGGTSAATPIMAGVEALVSKYTRELGPKAFYALKKKNAPFDITLGENSRYKGGCSEQLTAEKRPEEDLYLCHAETGYDSPSGWGTPNGAFEAAPAPLATTSIASGLTETGATLKGTVNPEEAETKYYFQYGTTDSYGKTTPEASAGSGTSGVEESKAVTGLSADTTYHFRVVATNGVETTYGADQVFTTFGTWSSQSIAGPAEAKETSLSRVSCVSSTVCTVVGSYVSSSGTELTLAERWNGTEWSIQTTPNPAEAKASSLSGVSCVSSTECIAVGAYKNSTGSYETLAERWNGTAWSIQTTPKEGAPSSLHEVSCGSSTSCEAVSTLESAGKAEHWNGTTWTVQSVPQPTGSKWDELEAVSCVSSTWCTAVGRYEPEKSTGAPIALAEHWNGTSWAVQSTPNTAEEGSNRLFSISCFSTILCSSVGWTLGATHMLADYWNGTAWSIQKLPEPNKGTLEGVSCSSAITCTAVGTAGLTQAERWTGTEWVIQTTPTVKVYTYMYSVSCPSVTFCIALGHSSGATTPYALIYD